MMRRLLEAIRPTAVLDAALASIAEHIQHNEPVDLARAASVLRDAGYKELVRQNVFWRALSHEITASDRQDFSTVGDLFRNLASGSRFERDGPQSFTTSLRGAVEFVAGVEWLHDHPPHYAGQPLNERTHSIWAIYEVAVEPSQILFSTRGLTTLLSTIEASPGTEALRGALFDTFQPYSHEDEVVIDTTHGVRVLNVHLYDSRTRED